MLEADIELEKAEIMYKLARKNNWGGKYDRLEHFKRFQHLSSITKDLVNMRWVLVHKKPTYTGISLNTDNKEKIIVFIENKMPHLKGMI